MQSWVQSIDKTIAAAVAVLLTMLGLFGALPVRAAPIIDLAAVGENDGVLRRIYGVNGNDGLRGVPVAGGHDVDGDGLVDYAIAFFQTSPLGRSLAGEVDLVFGDGTTTGAVDAAIPNAGILKFYGAAAREVAGSEIWIDDVTGDNLGDLLICRQNYSTGDGRIGAGALTIVPGGTALRTHAATLAPIDLAAAPPAGIALTTIHGARDRDRLCIWLRTGDVDGDGIADIVVGADQEDGLEPGPPNETNRGAVYVLRGGAHLAGTATVDLADFEQPVPSLGGGFDGNVAKFRPPAGATRYHFGATCQLADLDGNGRAEVLAAAALNRSSAGIGPTGSAEGSGGAPDGTLFIAWDDNFPSTPWANGYTVDLDGSAPGAVTRINGADRNITFGEEILAGLDYDGDTQADLFVGDLSGDLSGVRPTAGAGHIFFNAAQLRDLNFDLQTPPPALTISAIYGPIAGAIAGDTAAHGDFDGDSFADLAFCSPHANPRGRQDAGTIHVLFGRSGPWPAIIDTASPPSSAELRTAEIWGVQGGGPGDTGDTLCYSAASGDIDGDGRIDLLVNEMAGNGIAPAAVDAGNLLVISGNLLPLFADGFE